MTGNSSRGAAFVLAHWGLCVFMQVESYLAHIASGASAGESLLFFFALPFLQLEAVAGALSVGLFAFLGWRIAAFRLLAIVVLAVANFWLVADQVVYGVFFDHANLSLIDANREEIPLMLGSMADSVRQEFNWLVGINLAVALGSVVWAAAGSPPRLARPRASKMLIAGLFGWSSLSLLVTASIEHHNIAHYAPFTMLRSLAPQPEQPVGEPTSEADLLASLYDEAKPSDADDQALSGRLQELRRSMPQPDILFVMLESVGAKQLFPNGAVSKERTPNLAKLLEHAVVFDSVYSTFPGTVRSLVSMFLGGRHPTWGSVNMLLPVPYEAPTLVSSLGAAGYTTALYSVGEMNFESMNEFVANLGFTRVVDAADQPQKWKDAKRASSWGVEDDSLRESAVRWMASQKRRSKPFFLTYVTLATHHPYTWPAGYEGPFKGDDAHSRYLNALHSTDAFLGRMFVDLEREGVTDNLLIALVGDHGQAFGQLHAKNFTHKNYLYEENVRSYLALISPSGFSGATVSNRVASMGDVLGTVLEAAGGRIPGDVVGQSLWPESYRPRPVYFHKNAHPERWGLRDGRWKFVARKAGEREFELYDLASDPDEITNLAAQYPDRVEAYHERCAKWFATANFEFVARLAENPLGDEAALDADEIQSYGPKRLTFGGRDAAGEFVPADAVVAEWGAVVRTRWVSYPNDTQVMFEWTAPDGTTLVQPFEISADWSTTWLNYGGPLPMATGQWSLTLREAGQAVLSGGFRVE